jgi:hypothetical protein
MQIEEAKEDVLAYFAKRDLPEGVRERIMQKCKKWIIATWVTSFCRIHSPLSKYYNKVYESVPSSFLLIASFLSSPNSSTRPPINTCNLSSKMVRKSILILSCSMSST